MVKEYCFGIRFYIDEDHPLYEDPNCVLQLAKLIRDSIEDEDPIIRYGIEYVM